jgi:hypothetical protein
MDRWVAGRAGEGETLDETGGRPTNAPMLTVEELSLPLVGRPDQVRAQARELHHVPVHTLARVALTRHRLTELIALLHERLDEHDRGFGHH